MRGKLNYDQPDSKCISEWTNCRQGPTSVGHMNCGRFEVEGLSLSAYGCRHAYMQRQAGGCMDELGIGFLVF